MPHIYHTPPSPKECEPHPPMSVVPSCHSLQVHHDLISLSRSLKHTNCIRRTLFNLLLWRNFFHVLSDTGFIETFTPLRLSDFTFIWRALVTWDHLFVQRPSPCRSVKTKAIRAKDFNTTIHYDTLYHPTSRSKPLPTTNCPFRPSDLYRYTITLTHLCSYTRVKITQCPCLLIYTFISST